MAAPPPGTRGDGGGEVRGQEGPRPSALHSAAPPGPQGKGQSLAAGEVRCCFLSLHWFISFFKMGVNPIKFNKPIQISEKFHLPAAASVLLAVSSFCSF